MTDRELADHLDAQDRLRARGYVQEKCPSCEGTRSVSGKWMGILGDVREMLHECHRCDGRGYTWKAPITK